MRKSISLVLTIGMLYSSLSPVYSRVDAKLEAEIAREYKSFISQPIKGLKQQPCRAIQFVYHLHEQLHKEQKDRKNTKHTADKIAAVVSEGAGVGGMDTSRQATEDERKIAYGALCEAIDVEADIDIFTSELSKNFIIREHQEVVRTIFAAKIQTLFSKPSYNYLSDERGYQDLVKTIKDNLKAQEFEPSNSSSSSSKVTSKSSVTPKLEDDLIYQKNFKKVTAGMDNGGLAEVGRILLSCPAQNRMLLLEQMAVIATLKQSPQYTFDYSNLASHSIEERQWIMDKLNLFSNVHKLNQETISLMVVRFAVLHKSGNG